MAKLARLPANGRSAEAEAGVRHVPRLRTRYYAFLSYSHRDKELADWLHRELERFRVPHSLAGKLTANGVVPRRLSPVFRDQQDLSAGGDLAEEIKAALAASQFLVVLCSPTAATSPWTNQEIESFKRTRPEGCVLAAVAAGEPFASDLPGREHEECFPPALRYKYDRRGHQTTKRAEPLAADFREDGEGRRLGFLKLVAGMLGVGLDELVQRETTRRQRRLAYLAAASIAGMAVTSTLAVAAFQARNEARDQRREAEGLVEFMLGDLRGKLEPIGKLDVLDGVGSRVLSYYRKQDTSQLTDDALVQRSRALNLMAEVAFNRGDLKTADALYRQATAGTAEAVRRAPDDTNRIFDHAQNVFYVGEIARFGGRAAEAEQAWREYQRLANRMAELEPDNLKYRMEVFYANEDVGISLYNQHRFQEAARTFANAAGPMEKLASLYPDNVGYQKEFATMLAWVADVQRSQGRLDGAIATRQRQVSFLSGLLEKVSDADVRARLIVAHQGLGVALFERGQSARALQEFRSAINQADYLGPIEPLNAQWKKTAASVRIWFAMALLALGERDQAQQQTAGALHLTATLPAGGRSNSLATMVQARLALSSRATPQAISLARQALAYAQSEHGEDPFNDRFKIAVAYGLLGDAQQSASDRAGARASWTAALNQLPKNVADRPIESSERLQLLNRLGRVDEAARIAARLEAIGYRSLF
jgi:eukaryotic-like serine/threonine-protein kinase